MSEEEKPTDTGESEAKPPETSGASTTSATSTTTTTTTSTPAVPSSTASTSKSSGPQVNVDNGEINRIELITSSRFRSQIIY